MKTRAYIPHGDVVQNWARKHRLPYVPPEDYSPEMLAFSAMLDNVFCPTGDGGGRRNDCGAREMTPSSAKLGYARWGKQVSQREADAFRNYQEHALKEEWSAKMRSGALHPSMRSEVESMDKALLRAEAPRDMIVWRGVSSLQHVLETSPTFTATSLDRRSAKRYQGKSGVMMRISVPKGTKGVAYLGALPRSTVEDEVLFARGMRLRIDKQEGNVVHATVVGLHPTDNAFCPKGEGGGVDPSCGKGAGKTAPTPSVRRAAGIKEKPKQKQLFDEPTGKDHLEDIQAADKGKVAKVAAKLVKMGASAKHAEHAATAWVTDKIGANVAKLPKPMRTAVEKTWAMGKIGTQAAFIGWTASQAFAERVAKERGSTPEQAKALRGTLSAVDMLAFKPVAIAGGPLAAASWVIPPATAAYLAYSTARNPLATARAARGVVQAGFKGIMSKFTKKKPIVNAEKEDVLWELVDAIEAHDYDDWFIALFQMAFDETDDVMQGLDLAEELYAKNPKPPEQVEMEKRQPLRQPTANAYVFNCGGIGGKPGPCAELQQGERFRRRHGLGIPSSTGRKAQTMTERAVAASRFAARTGSEIGHKAAEGAHELAGKTALKARRRNRKNSLLERFFGDAAASHQTAKKYHHIAKLIMPDAPGAQPYKVTYKYNAENAFCPTGPGGGMDNSCGGKGKGNPSFSGKPVLPSIPQFISSQKGNVEANVKAAKEMKALAEKGDVSGLKAHPGTPSPKLLKYKGALLQALTGTEKQPLVTVPKPQQAPLSPPKAPAKPVTPPEGVKPATLGSKPDLQGIRNTVAQAVGKSPEAVKAAVTSPASPYEKEASDLRAKVTAAILEKGLAVENAVLHVKQAHNGAAVQARVQEIAEGEVHRALKEYADTPLYDLQCLSKIKVHTTPLAGQAVCYMSERRVEMGSTSVTGDFRHELGHAIHAALGGTGTHVKNATQSAIAAQYEDAMQRVKADPPPSGAHLSHDEYETKYGVVGRRGLDDWKENLAEHYRLYHREVYRDAKEGGEGKFLGQYRQRHPGWAKIWDSMYTAALLGGD